MTGRAVFFAMTALGEIATPPERSPVAGDDRMRGINSNDNL
jgi:hypothetical protein